MMYKYGSSDKETQYKEQYPAGTDGNTWATAYIQYCKDEGLIGGELDNKMTTPITRAEMATLPIPSDAEDAKSYVLDKAGLALASLNKVEAGITEALEDIRTERDAIAANIKVTV